MIINTCSHVGLWRVLWHKQEFVTMFRCHSSFLIFRTIFWSELKNQGQITRKVPVVGGYKKPVGTERVFGSRCLYFSNFFVLEMNFFWPLDLPGKPHKSFLGPDTP